MRYAIPLILLLAGAFLWFTPFATTSPPTHDSDAAIALALATFRPCEVAAEPRTPDPWEQQAAAMMAEFDAHMDAVLKEVKDIEAARAAKEQDADDEAFAQATVVQPKAKGPDIPPCGCGCMTTGQCKCENCCKRTADPQWQLDHHAYPIASAKRPGVAWADVDFDAAASLAAADGKCVFVEVSGPGCAPCKQMEATFADPVVAAILNARYVSVHVDTAKHPAFAAALSVTRIPTHIVFGPNRVLHWNQTGYRDARTFAADLIGAADEHPVNVFSPAPVQSFAPQIQYQPQRFFAAPCRSGY